MSGNLVISGGHVVGKSGAMVASGLSYSTNFPTIQNPLSEGGVWQNLGATANGGTFMQVGSSGKCYGTNVGTGYDDSYAHLSGWTSFPNQWMQIVVGLAPGVPDDGISRELEFHFRVNSDNTSGVKLYEVDISYIQTPVPLVRWNGTFGDFTVAAGGFGLNNSISNNDVLYAQIVNNVITLKQNGVSCGSVNVATDANIGGTVYASGNPGIGAFIRPGAANSDFFIRSFAGGTL